MTDYVAIAQIQIDSPSAQVWDALTDPNLIKKYMFGADVVTDWNRGSPIEWKGMYEGKSYEDKGVILDIEPERLLRVTHFSPLSGKEDVPSNYHTLTYELDGIGDKTLVSLSQDNNASAEEAEHSRSNWERMLSGLKEVVETS
jgi:uncharacterized protein YndB with AHSA1/START domain